MATRPTGGLGPGRAKWPDERRRRGIGIPVRRMMALLACDRAVATGRWRPTRRSRPAPSAVRAYHASGDEEMRPGASHPAEVLSYRLAEEGSRIDDRESLGRCVLRYSPE
jgi:hypothetical protein